MAQQEVELSTPALDGPLESTKLNIENDDLTTDRKEANQLSNNRQNKCLLCITTTRRALWVLFKRGRPVLISLVLACYLAYFIYAMIYSFGDEGSVRLLVVTLLILIGYLYHFVKSKFGTRILKWIREKGCYKRLETFVNKHTKLLQRILCVVVSLALFIYVLVDVIIQKPESLVSFAGLFVFVFVMFFFSKDPSEVIWRPVLWGLLLQFIFALVVLRSTWGYYAFDWLGHRVTEYLDHTDFGARFVFGPSYIDHYFALKVLPVIIFFSATISILYYLGWIQAIIEKIAFIMQYSLGTSPMESLHAAFNIFVGWGETLAFLRPFFDKMTLSEIHTIMANGFATVSGSTLVAYHLYGAPANHLLSASVMSAPAALAMSKLFYPESKANRKKVTQTEYKIERQGRNIVDAASIGAIGAISIVAYILASVIAFFSLLDFVNATLAWFGERVGLVAPEYPILSFELICSYIFWPLVFLMGVYPSDCLVAARMVGIKTFVNEFLAYEDLGKVIANRHVLEAHTGPWHWDTLGNVVLTNATHNSTLLIGGVMSERSEVITTYALCGFANITAWGIMIGAMTAVAPSRKDDIVKVSIRALLSGCMACFITACIAGFLTRV